MWGGGISINCHMPENGKFVLATYVNSHGNRRLIVGCFVEQYSFPSEDDPCLCVKYREEDGIYYLQEGWYEKQDNWDEYTTIYVNEGEVDFWSELPSSKELPTPARGGEEG